MPLYLPTCDAIDLTFFSASSLGIKCHVCGGSAFSEMVNQEINEVIAASNPDQGVNSNQTVEDEKKKFNSALKNSCGSSGTGTAVDCDLLPSENPEKRAVLNTD